MASDGQNVLAHGKTGTRCVLLHVAIGDENVHLLTESQPIDRALRFRQFDAAEGDLFEVVLADPHEQTLVDRLKADVDDLVIADDHVENLLDVLADVARVGVDDVQRAHVVHETDRLVVVRLQAADEELLLVREEPHVDGGELEIVAEKVLLLRFVHRDVEDEIELFDGQTIESRLVENGQLIVGIGVHHRVLFRFVLDFVVELLRKVKEELAGVLLGELPVHVRVRVERAGELLDLLRNERAEETQERGIRLLVGHLVADHGLLVMLRLRGKKFEVNVFDVLSDGIVDDRKDFDR